MCINLWQFRKVPFMSTCHCITKCFKMQGAGNPLIVAPTRNQSTSLENIKKDLENHCLVIVPLLPLDSCHILLKLFNPPPPSQSSPANFHQLNYPVVFLLSTCNEASAWLMYTYLAHRLSYSPASVGEWPREILPLIYHHLISENCLEIFLWFVTLSFDSPLSCSFSQVLKTFPLPFYLSPPQNS